LLIRSGKDPFTAVSAESTLRQNLLNSNAGNQLFQLSTHRALLTPGTEIVSNGTLSEYEAPLQRDVDLVNAEFDAFVVPLANAFRPDFVHRLDRLTALIEQLTIPVVVIGVGVQTDVAGDLGPLGEIDGPVRAFVSAVLERSASIGVRGEITKEYLQGLGLPEDGIDVIGCPSLFLHGPGFRLGTPKEWPGDDARISLNISPYVPGIGELSLAWTDRHPNLQYLGQVNDDLALMLWGVEPAEPVPAGVPMTLAHPLYQQGRVAFPLDLETWLEHLRTVDFSVGTRFHGNVTATLADTPAMLLVHDSRTLELAQEHGLPHRLVHEVTPDTPLEELYDAVDVAPFNDLYPAAFERFVRFLDRNRLDHVYAEGRGSTEFDDRMAATTFPPLVRPLPTDLPVQVRDRLLWLYRAAYFDSAHHADAYAYPLRRPVPPDLGSRHRRERKIALATLARHGDRLDRQAARIDGLRTRTESQTGRLDRQAARIDRLEAELAALLEARERGGRGRVLLRRVLRRG
jgi:hypothetical protein